MNYVLQRVCSWCLFLDVICSIIFSRSGDPRSVCGDLRRAQILSTAPLSYHCESFPDLFPCPVRSLATSFRPGNVPYPVPVCRHPCRVA
uniref:Putative secreted peptide n=1 Tax=Anopheles braziliensis TaxID=58242 RepID=A0A2M3ZRW9_9DIPT